VPIEGVRLDETIPSVMIDVFNEGDGDLHWTATTEDPWIELQEDTNYFRIKLKITKPGTYRGNVYVRAIGRGGSKRIEVHAEILEAAARPELSVSELKVDFGTLRVDSDIAPQVVRIENKGSGELQVRASSSNPALRVSATDKALTIEPNLSRAGSLAGEIEVTSAGGNATVNVTGEVESGPVLAVKPAKTLDFGNVGEDILKWKKLKIVNEGSGDLEWEVDTDGEFFSAECEGENDVKVSVAGNPPGDYLGTIRIRSNGGEATVTVRAHVVPAKRTTPRSQPPKLQPPPPPPAAIDLSGWWQNPNGRILISGRAPDFQYADYNAFGVQLGGGAMRLNGSIVSVQGTSLIIPYNGQFTLNGPMMSGVINILGAQNPVVYTRC
jgi:hypothetical protein